MEILYKQTIKRLFYSKKSHNVLNYFTLQIKDKQIAQQYK